MSRITARHTVRNAAGKPAQRAIPARSLPRWLAALPLAGILVACSSFAQSNNSADADRSAVVDFNSCAKPMYPHDELAAHHEGTVSMKFLVNVDGTVGASRVERTSGFPALDQAALEALSKCRFTPARKAGQPAQTWQGIQYVWTTE
ncbi:energy transducer TonB [Massilia sp. 9096]|uniref:energy transducer TonB n=1 Tax=Massilia sp. 9096 TaxID=1500894 RepID=UPI00068C2A8B|nr:energy transducer TonB [Massilia sp. 9096]